MKIVTRSDIRSILLEWQQGALRPDEVHAWAEDRYAAPAFEPEDDIANEVLANLDILNINVTTVEDIPVFLEMLLIPSNEIDRAVALLTEHDARIDMATRMRKYSSDSFYGRFCSKTSE